MKNGKLDINEACDGVLEFRKAAEENVPIVIQRQTNGDKYFGSYEKIAEFISNNGCSRCPLNGAACRKNPEKPCRESIIEWLQEECE